MLKQWALNNGQLVRYYRPYREVVTSYQAPAGVGYQRDLYRLEGWPEQSITAIERQYMGPVVDDPAAKAIEALLAPEHTHLTTELRTSWVRFLMSLVARTPNSVASLEAEWGRLWPEAIDADPEQYLALRKPNDPETFGEWVKENYPAILNLTGKHILPELIENKDVGSRILRMRWKTIRLNAEFPDLLLGDNPLVVTHDIQNPQCVVSLPLSPKHLFVASANRATIEMLSDRSGSTLARAMNESTIRQADRDVFGASGRHLRFVENRLRQRAT